MPLNQLAKSVYPPPRADCLVPSIYKHPPGSPPFARLQGSFNGSGGILSPILPASHSKNRSGHSSSSSFDNPELPGDYPGTLGRIREVSYENSFSKPADPGQSVPRLPSLRDAPKQQQQPPVPEPAFSPVKAAKKSLDLRALRRRFLDKSKQSLPQQLERFARTLTKAPTEE